MQDFCFTHLLCPWLLGQSYYAFPFDVEDSYHLPRGDCHAVVFYAVAKHHLEYHVFPSADVEERCQGCHVFCDEVGRHHLPYRPFPWFDVEERRLGCHAAVFCAVGKHHLLRLLVDYHVVFSDEGKSRPDCNDVVSNEVGRHLGYHVAFVEVEMNPGHDGLLQMMVRVKGRRILETCPKERECVMTGNIMMLTISAAIVLVMLIKGGYLITLIINYQWTILWGKT